MKRITRSTLVGASVLSGLFVAVAAQAGGEGKVLLCHGTASEQNPYVLIEVSENALQGHFDGTAPGHGWQNAPDFVLPDGFATCADALDGEGGGTL